MENKTHIAEVNAKSLPISTKMSVEICRNIRYLGLAKAKRVLQDVVSMKRALPIKRFDFDLGHKPGMAAGRYPIKASQAFIKLLNSLESNAENKGLNVNNLVIVHANANKAENTRRHGRKGNVKN